jgi:hypothetical protein
MSESIKRFRIIKNAIAKEFDLPVGDFIERGSSFEDLKVMEPDEFDCLVPIHHYCLKQITLTIGPYYALRKTCPNCGEPMAADLVRNKFQSVVQRFINNYNGQSGFQLSQSKRGPATMLKVTQHDRLLFTVDFVPQLILEHNPGGKAGVWVIAKSPPVRRSQRFWMRTSCEEESEYVQRLPKEFRKVLMIVKVLRLYSWCNEIMTVIPSYFYKTACLHWHSENPTIRPLPVMIVNFFHFISTCLRGGGLH